LRSANATHYIYANVSSWKYACALPAPREGVEELNPRLHLDAAIVRCTILEKGLPLGICIIGNNEDHDDANLSPWRLDLIPHLDDPPLPRCLETVLTLSEIALKDVKECLFVTAQSSSCYVQVNLGLQEILSTDIAERSFAIVEFGYALHNQKETI